MSPYKTAAFKYVFPKLYPSNFHFECGDGWFKLLWEMSEKLAALKQDEIVAAQIKEKYGTLRAYFDFGFYVEGKYSEARDIINQYEWASSEICEDCGAAGRERDGGWVRTLCDDCCGEER